MGEYAVIRFSVDESFSEIPLSWICPGRKECWWPKAKNVANLMARNVPPDKENWEKRDIEMIAFSSSLESARKKAVDSEYYTTSDEGSRGRGKRLKKPKNLSSSSDEDEGHTPPPALKKRTIIENHPLTNQTIHTPPPVPKMIPSRENYSLSKQSSDQLKSKRHAEKDISHHSDHESSNSEHFISTDTTQENNFEENDDITLVSKENISQAEEISSMSENIKKILSVCKGTLLEVRSMNERLSKIESSENASKVDVSGIMSEKLPCESIQDIERLENLLKDSSEFKESFTVFVKNIGGRNAKEHINRSLQRMFTNALGRECSWLGYRNNFKMKDLQSIRILIGVITCKLSLSESDVEMKISEWFRLSKLRHQRERTGPTIHT